MTIYTRWGGECTILAKFGKSQPPYLADVYTLVLVKYLDGNVRFYWAEFLRADNGWTEIEPALELAPEYGISSGVRYAAFEEAE